MRKIALLYLFFSMNSFAQTIVSYDFNSGNQGWTLSGSSISGGRIFMNGNSNGVATSPVINLSGISQAQVSVDWNCVDESSGFESSDVIHVEYWNGSSWVVLWTWNGDQICPSDNDNQNGNTGNLLLQAGLSSTQIRLVSTTNSSSEDMFWDNVVVSQPIDPCDAVASGNLDTDGDGISDSCDLDDDNDGILDTSEGEVVCQSAAPINLAPYDNQTNTEQIFTNNSITVAGIEIGLDHTAFGSGSISTDEINDGHVAGEIGVVIGHSGNVDSFNDRIESEYTFSAPVSDFQFSIHDMDAGDRMIINAYDENNTIIPITASMYTIITPSDINYLGGNQFRDVTGSSSSGLQGTVRLDYTGFSVTRLVIQYWDDESSGSYTFYPELGSGCVYDIEGDTDNDGIPDRLDLDSDNDGCFDAIEADENVTIADLNPDGSISGGVDTDGVPTLVNNSGSADIGGDQGQGAGAAQDNTDFSACCPSSVSGWTDSDGDDVSDRCDLDDDNDGITDLAECPPVYFVSPVTTASITVNGTITSGTAQQLVDGEGAGGTGPGPFPYWYTNETNLPLEFSMSMQTPSTIDHIKLYSPWGIDEWVRDFTVEFYDNSNALLGIEYLTAPDQYTGTPIIGFSQEYTTVSNVVFTIVSEQGYNSFDRVSLNEIVFLDLQICDTDNDGVVNQLDLDSDNDGCTDAVEGGGTFDESDLVTAGGSVTVGTGSSASNQNLCEDNSCVDANGIPTIAAGGQGIGLSQDSTQTECYCTQPGLGGTATEFTQIGVSDREAIAPGWPGTIQNGFIVIESEDSGFVITRVEQATDIVNPVEGMLIYDIADQCVKLYNGAVWKCLERSCN